MFNLCPFALSNKHLYSKPVTTDEWSGKYRIYDLVGNRSAAVNIERKGKVKIIASDCYSLRVSVSTIGDGEPNGEPFIATAYFKMPPFGYSEEGMIHL